MSAKQPILGESVVKGDPTEDLLGRYTGKVNKASILAKTLGRLEPPRAESGRILWQTRTTASTAIAHVQ